MQIIMLIPPPRLIGCLIRNRGWLLLSLEEFLKNVQELERGVFKTVISRVNQNMRYFFLQSVPRKKGYNEYGWGGGGFSICEVFIYHLEKPVM